MNDTKKTCAKCKHLILNHGNSDDLCSNYMCIHGEWCGIEHAEDIYEPVDCEFYEEAADEQRD